MMMRSALLALSLALAGCSGGGPSVSGSADEGARSSSGTQSLWERVRSLGTDQSKSVEMPALGLMADAFLSDYAARGLDFDTVAQVALDRSKGDLPQFDRAVASMIEPTRKSVARVPAATAASITPLDAAHMVYSGPLVIALQPRKGWEVDAMDDRRVDPVFDTPFFRQNRRASTYDPQRHIRYMEMLAISAIYTNTVFGMITASWAPPVLPTRRPRNARSSSPSTRYPSRRSLRPLPTRPSKSSGAASRPI